MKATGPLRTVRHAFPASFLVLLLAGPKVVAGLVGDVGAILDASRAPVDG
jgi:hypothetical protein